MTSGFTDSRIFRQRGVASFGFIPCLIPPGELAGIHGHDERMRRLSVQQPAHGTPSAHLEAGCADDLAPGGKGQPARGSHARTHAGESTRPQRDGDAFHRREFESGFGQSGRDHWKEPLGVTRRALLAGMGQDAHGARLISRQCHRDGPEAGIECEHDHAWIPALCVR